MHQGKRVWPQSHWVMAQRTFRGNPGVPVGVGTLFAFVWLGMKIAAPRNLLDQGSCAPSVAAVPSAFFKDDTPFEIIRYVLSPCVGESPFVRSYVDLQSAQLATHLRPGGGTGVAHFVGAFLGILFLPKIGK